MGGPGSGHGIKRSDHSKNSGYATPGVPSKHKHLKSLFSDKLDPSCHALKKERDRAAGIPEDPQAEVKKEVFRMEYKDMQKEARKRVKKAWETIDEILNNPEASDTAKMAAFHAIHDRAFGKAATLNYNIDATMEAKPAEMSEDELRKRVGTAILELEASKGTSGTNEGEGRPNDIRKYN